MELGAPVASLQQASFIGIQTLWIGPWLRDVAGQAQTGTGKTAAFALPILQRLIGGERFRRRFRR